MVEKKGFFQKIEDGVVNAAEDYVKEKVQKKIYRIGEFSILVVLGFFLIAFGISLLISYYFPVLKNGFSFVIMGLFLLLIAYFMKV